MGVLSEYGQNPPVSSLIPILMATLTESSEPGELARQILL